MDVTLEKYNLSYLYQHFTGSFLENAHQSIADCRALERVFYESKMPQKIKSSEIKNIRDYTFVPSRKDVKNIRFVGPKTSQYLYMNNIKTVGDLRSFLQTLLITKKFEKDF